VGSRENRDRFDAFGEGASRPPTAKQAAEQKVLLYIIVLGALAAAAAAAPPPSHVFMRALHLSLPHRTNSSRITFLVSPRGRRRAAKRKKRITRKPFCTIRVLTRVQRLQIINTLYSRIQKKAEKCFSSLCLHLKVQAPDIYFVLISSCAVLLQIFLNLKNLCQKKTRFQED
jgi:hypothetical protein